MSTNIFNPQRQYHFVLRQFSLYQQRWFIAAAVIFGLMLIISVLQAIFNPAGLYYIRDNYNGFFFIGGIILTSQIFLELHYPNRSYSFLSLPASTLDKLIGSWLLTSPLYIIVFTLGSFAIYAISFLIAGIPFSFSHFFTASYGNTIATYLVVQTIFFWGACYFRKNNLLKTLLFLILLFFVLGIYTIFMAWIFVGEGTQIQIHSPGFQQLWDGTLKTIIEVSFWLLGPYMLLMSYYTLKERQV